MGVGVRGGFGYAGVDAVWGREMGGTGEEILFPEKRRRSSKYKRPSTRGVKKKGG